MTRTITVWVGGFVLATAIGQLARADSKSVLKGTTPSSAAQVQVQTNLLRGEWAGSQKHAKFNAKQDIRLVFKEDGTFIQSSKVFDQGAEPKSPPAESDYSGIWGVAGRFLARRTQKITPLGQTQTLEVPGDSMIPGLWEIHEIAKVSNDELRLVNVETSVEVILKRSKSKSP